MSEFKSQYDRQKESAENAHYYELLYYLQQLIFDLITPRLIEKRLRIWYNYGNYRKAVRSEL